MPTTFQQYKVFLDQDVTVDVVIGDGQPGGSTIYLDNMLVTHTAPRDPGSVTDEDINVYGQRIGSGDELVGKTLVISTDVLDLRDIDQAVVTVTLRGGSPSEKGITLKKKDDPFTSVNFTTIVDFVA